MSTNRNYRLDLFDDATAWIRRHQRFALGALGAFDARRIVELGFRNAETSSTWPDARDLARDWANEEA